ncbi:MAG: DUF4139 domain-containing protein [Desulfovibrio sp.]|nr:DUF4139 domain-containing protein [Desulfovibrio sp.]
MPFTRSPLAVPAAALLWLLSATTAPAFAPDPAQPAEAVFYPDEARLTVSQNLEAEKLPSGATGFVLVLPAGADPDSFMLRIDGVPAQSIYRPDEQEAESLLGPLGRHVSPFTAALPDRESSPERRALLEKVVALETEQARARGAAAAAEARLALLRKSFDVYGASPAVIPAAPPADRSGKKSGTAFSPAGEASALDADYADRYPKVYAERDKQQRILADLAPRLEKARKALQDYDDPRKRDLYIVPHPADKKRHSLTYTYALPAACSLLYTLDAAPDTGEIAVYQEATLTQNSGIAWNDTDIYIAALRRDRILAPPKLRTWEIITADKTPPQPLTASAPADDENRPVLRQALRAPASDAATPRPAPAKPAQTEQAAFRLHHVGKQTLQHNTPLRLHPAPEILKAAFSYTLRPSVTDKAFLAAALTLPGPLALPPAPARFSVDGVVVGNRNFSFNSDKGTIFFGTDPQVSAEMRNLARSGGEHGLFAKDETFTRHWLFTVRNLRKRAVDIALEDPAPVSENDAVYITTHSTPQPETRINAPEEGGAKVYVWKARLESGAELHIDHKVEARAPQDKNKILIPGR